MFHVFAWLCLAVFLAACSNIEKCDLNIPEGDAVKTLKEFAQQTNVEIVFDRQIVYGVETNAVKGRYEPSSALRIMGNRGLCGFS